MSNPVPESVPGVEPGEMVAVTVVGRLRTSVDGAVTLEVADVQEPVLRLPWGVVQSVATAVTADPPAYDWAAARQAARWVGVMTARTAADTRSWRSRRVGFPPEIVFQAEAFADPGFDVEAAPGSDLIAVGRYDLTISQAATLSAILADAVAVALAGDDVAASEILRGRGAEVTP